MSKINSNEIIEKLNELYNMSSVYHDSEMKDYGEKNNYEYHEKDKKIKEIRNFMQDIYDNIPFDDFYNAVVEIFNKNNNAAIFSNKYFKDLIYSYGMDLKMLETILMDEEHVILQIKDTGVPVDLLDLKNKKYWTLDNVNYLLKLFSKAKSRKMDAYNYLSSIFPSAFVYFDKNLDESELYEISKAIIDFCNNEGILNVSDTKILLYEIFTSSEFFYGFEDLGKSSKIFELLIDAYNKAQFSTGPMIKLYLLNVNITCNTIKDLINNNKDTFIEPSEIVDAIKENSHISASEKDKIVLYLDFSK